MSRNARFYFFAGMLVVLLLLSTLALSGYFAIWWPPQKPFVVKSIEFK